MFIGVSKAARAAGGGSVKQDKKFIEAVNKALQHSSLVNEKVITKVTQDLNRAIQSGNEEIVILLKKQLEALKAAQNLSKSPDAELARQFQKGQKLSTNQYHDLTKYLSNMNKLSTDLNMVLQTNLSSISDSMTKLINGDVNSKAKLQSAKQLAQVIGNSGLFDNSHAFKELLEFTKTQTELSEQSNKQLIELVDGMNTEVQSVDKLNDLIKIAQDSSKDDKTQTEALDNIITTIETSNKYLPELTQLKNISNSSEAMSSRLNKLVPVLKSMGDTSLQTRTLYTLQQLEFSMKKMGSGAAGKLKAGAAGAGGFLAAKAGEHKSDMMKLLLSQIPGLGQLDMATGGLLSDKAGDVAAMGATYAGAKTLGKAKKLFTGRAASRAEGAAAGAAERAAAAGGTKGLSKLLSKGGKYGKIALAGLAGYELLSGSDAEAADLPKGMAVPNASMMSQAAPDSGANPLTELGIYAAAPKIAEKTGIAALASKGGTKAATSLLGETAGGALAKGGKAVLGKAGGLANAAVGVYDYATANNTAERKEAIGSFGGTLAGAAAGAAIGSVVPILGTGIGAVIGGIVASGAGNWIGTQVADVFKNPQDDIPDDIKKKGPITEAAYIDDMVKSGKYSDSDIKELKKYQTSLLSDQNISDYVKNVSGGNIDKLMQVMSNSALPAMYPDVYKDILDYANTKLIPEQKNKDARNVTDIHKSLNVVDAKQSVGKSVSATGGVNQPSTNVDNLQVKTQKSVTDLNSLPKQDQDKISNIIDANTGDAKADEYVDSSGQHSLTNKLMGWVSNVLPTGIFPMVTLGVDAGGDAGFLAKFMNSGGYFSNTKDQSAGFIPKDYLSYPTVASQPNPALATGMTNESNRINVAKDTKFERVRSFRNNNFGNIEFRNQAGATMGDAGRFARWETPEEGLRAVSNQLVRYFTGKTTGRQLSTVKDIINTWAPSAENNTPGYIDSVAKAIGVAPTQPLDLLNNPQQMREMVKAISKVEGGADLNSLGVSDKFIDTALGSYNQKTGKYEGAFNPSTLETLNANRESSGLLPVTKDEQYGNIKAPTNNNAIAQSTGTIITASGITTTPTTVPNASGITLTPSPLDPSSATLVKQNEVMKNQAKVAPPIMSQPAPQAGPSAPASIRPPSNIDDYGIAFANKLMWDM